MKKNYYAPIVQVVTEEYDNLLCNSAGVTNEDFDDLNNFEW